MSLRVVFASVVLILTTACAGTGGRSGLRTVTAPDAPRALPTEGTVQVNWSAPDQFSDIRLSGNAVEAARGDWVYQLAAHMRQTAEKRLPPGQTLAIHITDIRRAGIYEPWRGPRMQDVRIIRDLYPPRMELEFKLADSAGQILSEGQRDLVDSGFLFGASPLGDSDPLRYEKSMIDRWLGREFGPGSR